MVEHSASGKSDESKQPSTGQNTTQTSITDYTKDVWQTVSFKKRKLNGSPSPTKENGKKNKNANQPIKTGNKFAALSEPAQDTGADAEMQKMTNDDSVKKITPPPIFVKGVEDFKGMMERITKTIPVEHVTTKSLANKAVKIIVSDVESYRKLVKEFRSRGVAFHTYQLKSERAFRVVLRGIHQSCSTDDIIKAINDLGYSVRNVANIRHHQTKDPLPLFFVDLEPAENNSTIYDLRSLLNQSIKVESPRPRKDVIQCQRCQQFNHTRTYCTQPPICVKCGLEHEPRDCAKPRDTSPKCGLCEGEHTANYRGCPEYLKLKRGHLKSTTRPNSNDRTKFPRYQTTDESNAHLGNNAQTAQSTNTITYAQMASSRPSNQSVTDSTRTEQLLVKMCGQFEMMCQQMQNMFEQNKQMLSVLLKLIEKIVP